MKERSEVWRILKEVLKTNKAIGVVYNTIFFRLGAPFFEHFTRQTSHLEAAGILDLWLHQVKQNKIKENRAQPYLPPGVTLDLRLSVKVNIASIQTVYCIDSCTCMWKSCRK